MTRFFKIHHRGRVLTDGVVHFAPAAIEEKSESQRKARESLFEFVRMYDPHEAREDTVVFPEFRTELSRGEYDDIAGLFLKKEQRVFHGDGFMMAVDTVADIEKQLGIFELSKFDLSGQPTPR